MELEIQKYLRTGKTPADLELDYGIKTRQSEDFPELYLFKYSQIDSPMKETIVQECRGIILNKEDNWAVVARPYNKFFNYGEDYAKDLVWSTAKVYEKLDGSLMTLYWYKDQWRVSTSGNPDASGQVWNSYGHLVSFKELFWATWFNLEYMIPSKRYKHTCFIFELMTPFNRVVVQHESSNLVLHGVRSIESGTEYFPDYPVNFMGANWKVCKCYPFDNIETVIKNTSKLNPLEQEGYIVVDNYFNRVKVKSPQYVALHHMRDSMSPRAMLEIVRSNEGDEVLTYFPEYIELYNNLKYKLAVTITTIKATVELLKSIYGESPSRKEIGLASKELSYRGLLFPILFEGKDIEDILFSMAIKKLEDLIKDITEKDNDPKDIVV